MSCSPERRCRCTFSATAASRARAGVPRQARLRPANSVTGTQLSTCGRFSAGPACALPSARRHTPPRKRLRRFRPRTLPLLDPQGEGMKKHFALRGFEWDRVRETVFAAVACEGWCRLGDSNPRPRDYKSRALPAELSRLRGARYDASGRDATPWKHQGLDSPAGVYIVPDSHSSQR